MTAPAAAAPPRAAAARGAAVTNGGLRLLGQLDAAITVKLIRAVGVFVSCLGFVLAVLAAAATNAWTSDDTFVQNMVRSLLDGAAFAPVVGGDNFAIKAPLYALVSLLLPDGSMALTVTTVAVNLPLVAALLLLADRATAARGRAAIFGGYLLVAWFLVSRIAPMSSLMIPNGRNGEIGVAVLLLVWWAGPSRGRLETIGRCLSILPLALLFFSDGFFIYVSLGTAALVAGAAWIYRLPYARRATWTAAGVAFAAVLGLALERIARIAGLEVLQNYANSIPAAGSLPAYLATVLGSIARNFNADTTGRPLGATAVPSLLQVLLMLVVLVFTVRVLRSGLIKEDLRLALGIAAVSVNIGLYLLTSNAADPYSYRYVLLAAVLLLLLAVAGIGVKVDAEMFSRHQRLVWTVAVVGVLGVLLGLALNTRTVIRAATGDLPDAQGRTARIIDIAEARGLSVGVGDYWDGNITTYLSRGRVRVIPQDCTSGRMATRAWLINKPEVAAAARAEFVVIRVGTGCTPEVAEATFGEPIERVALPETGDAVWIYDGRLG